jgi:NAD(P)-dependent dehydrogenase (short-subunit alcohol dehydrogenase family)
MSPPNLAGKTIVVTHGSTELSLTLARRMEAAGAQVVVGGSRSGDDTDDIERLLRTHGVEAHYKPFDARVPGDSETLVNEIVREFGALDVWVNSLPQVNIRQTAEEVTQDQWDTALTLALTSSFYGCQAAARHMLRAGEGVIINLSLAVGLHPTQGFAVESTVSGALMSMTQALGIEWAPRGVRVVGVATGPLEATQNLYGDVAVRTPLRRLGTAEEVAEAVIYLASDEAGFVTAETLPVDGGWSSFQMF